MDKNQLTAFDHVAREGSFTRAAVTLRLGQPAVSARMKALEAELGGALFTRGRRVSLTALGESFLPFARRALEVLEEGMDASRRAQRGGRGRVRLGALASLAGGLVGPAMAGFMRAHPEVDCLVRSGDHERIVSLLLDGVVDLGIVVWPCTEAASADLQAIFSLREPVTLVASPTHPLARRGRIEVEELVRLGRPFFRLRWWQAHHPLLIELAERVGGLVDVPMEPARRLAIEGVGVGFFPQTYIEEDLRRGTLATVEVKDLPRLYRDSALVRRGAGGLSPATANLVEAIRRQAVALGTLRRAPRSRAQ